MSALVPFFGILMDRHPTRRAFLSRLMGVELTEEEFRQLVEPDHVDRQGGKSLEEYLKIRIAEMIHRISPEALKHNITMLRQLMLDEVLARTRLPPSQFPRVLSNLDSLLDAEKSLMAYPARVLPADKERATWFATEENYSRTRAMWLSGRFTGMTADITGPQTEVLGLWLKERNLSVSAIYVSNVPEYYSGRERQALFDNLRRLPLEPDSVILMTRRSKRDFTVYCGSMSNSLE